MKEQGMLPPRPWQEKPLFISATSAVFEGYVPPEGDGKLSAISLGVRKKLIIVSLKGPINIKHIPFTSLGSKTRY